MQLGTSESTKRPRPRQRVSTSCTECRRRKQKCNQAKDRPCNNCARRFPPVVCHYDSDGQSPPGMDSLLEFEVADAPLGEASSSSAYYSGYGTASQEYMYAGENELAQNIPSSYSTPMATYSTSDNYSSRAYASQPLGSSSAAYGSQGDGYAGVNEAQYYSTSYTESARAQAYGDSRGAAPFHICELEYGASVCSTCHATASQQPSHWPPTSQ
ncbi:hypothetical protein F5884DRAFT_63354 [Xylogone sp. PMI_703]|nr:hypothetical protein F5884DRAFT_63354 [Xylogone sp. PMI_703]